MQPLKHFRRKWKMNLDSTFAGLAGKFCLLQKQIMKICRFNNKTDEVRIGLVADNSTLLDLTTAGITQLSSLLESENPVAQLNQLAGKNLPRVALAGVKLLAPVERQEVWAAGVTYLRSKTARMEESDFSATAYDKVYAAERPEIFFKSMPEKVVATGEAVGIRRDAKWNVPEPELALVMNSRGQIVGHTIGNDMSSRDIEGENLLYLPQAKVYDRSCALGPWIHLGATEADAREWKIKIEIRRDGKNVFNGETSVSQIKRDFAQLAEFLFRSQKFPHGAVLLTGTGIVPPDTFTLRERDEVEIEISGIGSLQNRVVTV
jgi:2-dehydro-3-deoxy-D-arabinonate dehydratase